MLHGTYYCGGEMSKQPPDDESLLESIFTQLHQAISDSDPEEDPEVNEELMEGIRNSLSALFGNSIEMQPPVTLVEGGKKEDSSVEERKPPELFFAPEPENFYTESGQELSDVQVRVFKGKDLFHKKSNINNGQIVVQDDEEQVLLHSSTEHLYRIFCTEGTLIVLSQVGLQVSAGQSVDVEAKYICVKGGGSSKGYYTRISE